MAQVQTVRGPIDSSTLGTTLMHEHVFVLIPKYFRIIRKSGGVKTGVLLTP